MVAGAFLVVYDDVFGFACSPFARGSEMELGVELCTHCPLMAEEHRRAALARLAAMPAGAMMSAPDMAVAFHLPAEALRKRLDHFRTQSDSWREVQDGELQDARKNEPRIVYRLGAIVELLRDMLTAAAYQG